LKVGDVVHAVRSQTQFPKSDMRAVNHGVISKTLTKDGATIEHPTVPLYGCQRGTRKSRYDQQGPRQRRLPTNFTSGRE